MIINKSLYKLLQIIRSIAINNKNSQKLSLCYDVDFFKMQTSGGGGLNIRTRGVKNGQKIGDVLYGWPLMHVIDVKSIP